MAVRAKLRFIRCGSSLVVFTAALAAPRFAAADFNALLRTAVPGTSLEAVRVRGAVARLYPPIPGGSLWSGPHEPNSRLASIVSELADAESRGLNADDYHARLWSSRMADLRAGRLLWDHSLDIAFSADVVRYVLDLRVGRIDPRAAADFDPAAWIRASLLNSRDIRGAFASLEPPFAAYEQTKRALLSYRKFAAAGTLPKLPPVTSPIKPGDSYTSLAELALILTRVGDLPPRSLLPSDDCYSGPLIDAVKRFQSRHGLDPDGVIGKATVTQLNTPLEERIRALRLTLERWRSLPRTFRRPPILVNIPEFRLRALDEHMKAALSMKVVVGQAYGHQTPLLIADMRYLIFRPYWDVPATIARKELLPKLEEDPAYFARNHYEVVTLAGGSTRIRQLPGPDNALGGVKFLFLNPDDIYLHGTPAVELFRRSRRDFSHGCIRVENPQELAAWVLRDQPEWTRDRIRDAMNGSKPLRVDLTAPIPVLIVYGTAFATGDGEVHFFPDLYQLDTKVAQQLGY